jgi:hypothetical protein
MENTADIIAAEQAEDAAMPEGPMPWETEAQEAVETVLKTIKYNSNQTISLDTEVDHKQNPIAKDFSSAEDIRCALIDIAETVWCGECPWDSGEPVFSPDVETMVDEALEKHKIEEFFSL